MRRLTLIVLICVACCEARPMRVWAGEPCVQVDYRARCPIAIDPNVICDAVLGPVPGDPNTWSVKAGLYRRWLDGCDPDGDPYRIALASSRDNAAKIVVDANGVSWLEATPKAMASPYWAFVTMSDVPPPDQVAITRVFLIIFEVRGPNRGPVMY